MAAIMVANRHMVYVLHTNLSCATSVRAYTAALSLHEMEALSAKQHSCTGVKLLYSCCAVRLACQQALNCKRKCSWAKYVPQLSAVVDTCMAASLV